MAFLDLIPPHQAVISLFLDYFGGRSLLTPLTITARHRGSRGVVFVSEWSVLRQETTLCERRSRDSFGLPLLWCSMYRARHRPMGLVLLFLIAPKTARSGLYSGQHDACSDKKKKDQARNAASVSRSSDDTRHKPWFGFCEVGGATCQVFPRHLPAV